MKFSAVAIHRLPTSGSSMPSPTLESLTLDESHSLRMMSFRRKRRLSVRQRLHRLSAFCKTQHSMSSRRLSIRLRPVEKEGHLPSHQSREWERPGLRHNSQGAFLFPASPKQNILLHLSIAWRAVVLVCSREAIRRRRSILIVLSLILVGLWSPNRRSARRSSLT